VERRYGDEGALLAQLQLYSRAAWKSSPNTITSAPNASVAAFLSGELPSGTTIVTGTPNARPAYARLWLWLPRDADTSPAGRPCSASECETKFSPPRTLNAPVGVWFSCLIHTSAPVARARSGQAYAGVVGTYSATKLLVAARDSRVIGMAATVPRRLIRLIPAAQH